MKESTVGKHGECPLQEVETIDYARAFFYQNQWAQSLRQHLEEKASGKMCPAPQPATGPRDRIIRLFTEADLGHRPHESLVHLIALTRAEIPPFRHGFGGEQMKFRKPVHLWMLAEHRAYDPRKSARRGKNKNGLKRA